MKTMKIRTKSFGNNTALLTVRECKALFKEWDKWYQGQRWRVQEKWVTEWVLKRIKEEDRKKALKRILAIWKVFEVTHKYFDTYGCCGTFEQKKQDEFLTELFRSSYGFK